MTQMNYMPNQETIEPAQPSYTSSVSNLLQRLIVNGDYAMLWNQYIKSLIRVQEAVQQINQGILRAYGFPTREDLGRVNSQIFELNNRLDELENRLNERSESTPAGF